VIETILAEAPKKFPTIIEDEALTDAAYNRGQEHHTDVWARLPQGWMVKNGRSCTINRFSGYALQVPS